MALQASCSAAAQQRLALAPCAAASRLAPASSAPSRGLLCPGAPLQRRAGSSRLAVRAAAVAPVANNAKKATWEQMWDFLVMQNGFRSTVADEVNEMITSGDWVMVDVRPASDYEKSHPEGAINVPIFQATDFSKPDFVRYLRAVAMAVNGVTPVEPNEEFCAQVAEAAAGRGVVVMCEAGGTLEPSTNFMHGKTSRSLKAAYKLLATGTLPLGKVAHLSGGAFGWFRSGLPFTGEYTADMVGRTPSAVEEKIFDYGQSAKKPAVKA